jgi:ferredoxin
MCVLCVLCLSSDAVFERFFNNTLVCPFDAFSQEFLIAKIAKKQKKLIFFTPVFSSNFER